MEISHHRRRRRRSHRESGSGVSETTAQEAAADETGRVGEERAEVDSSLNHPDSFQGLPGHTHTHITTHITHTHTHHLIWMYMYTCTLYIVYPHNVRMFFFPSQFPSTILHQKRFTMRQWKEREWLRMLLLLLFPPFTLTPTPVSPPALSSWRDQVMVWISHTHTHTHTHTHGRTHIHVHTHMHCCCRWAWFCGTS